MGRITRVSAVLGCAAALALALTTCAGTLLAHAQHAADGAVMTIRPTATARFFDMSPAGADLPPGWMSPGFDDSAWDQATAVKTTNDCDGLSIGHGDFYWGPQAADEYLMRQTFVVPKARSYEGSELTITTTAQLSSDGGQLPYLALNGTALHPTNTQRDRLSIVHYLRPGRNVLTAYLKTYSSSLCNAVQDALTLRLTGLQHPASVVLSWRPIRHATRYDVQVWLVAEAPGQRNSSDAQVNVAVQTVGPRATLDATAMPAGTYAWRAAAVNTQGAVISRWTAVHTVTVP